MAGRGGYGFVRYPGTHHGRCIRRILFSVNDTPYRPLGRSHGRQTWSLAAHPSVLRQRFSWTGMR